MWYPKWVYHYREDLTQENMRKYEQMKDEFYKKCEEICPNFWNIDLYSRLKYMDEAKKVLGYSIFN